MQLLFVLLLLGIGCFILSDLDLPAIPLVFDIKIN